MWSFIGHIPHKCVQIFFSEAEAEGGILSRFDINVNLFKQNVHLSASAKVSTHSGGGHSTNQLLLQQQQQQQQQQEMQHQQPYRGFDISYSSAMARHEELVGEAANNAAAAAAAAAAHRAISKPLTVQQLEAALLKKDPKVTETETWPSSPNNDNVRSIWTPLTGPSLWNGTTVFSKVKLARRK